MNLESALMLKREDLFGRELSLADRRILCVSKILCHDRFKACKASPVALRQCFLDYSLLGPGAFVNDLENGFWKYSDIRI